MHKATKDPWIYYFVQIPYSIIVHPNYLTMPPSCQQIILDFKRQYDRHTDFSREPQPKEGIPYSYGHCLLDIHRNTFRSSMDRLQHRGFLKETSQVSNDGQVGFYHWISQWRKYTLTEQERKRLRKLRTRVQNREKADMSTTCTYIMHPPAQLPANPALNFWAKHPHYMHYFGAGVPIEEDKEIKYGACARTKQEEYQPSDNENAKAVQATMENFKRDMAAKSQHLA